MTNKKPPAENKVLGQTLTGGPVVEKESVAELLTQTSDNNSVTPPSKKETSAGKDSKSNTAVPKNKGRINPKIWFAVPFVLFLIMMVVVPLSLLFYNAFINDTNGSFTFDNFAALFRNADTIRIIFVSMGIAALSALICVIIAFPIAYGLATAKFKRAPTILLLFIAPMWVNLLLRSFALRSIFDALRIQQGLGALLISIVIDYLPLAILPIYIVLTGVSKKYVEASYDLGATRMQAFYKTILPLSIPGIITGFLLVFTPAISTYFLSMYFGGTIEMIGERLNGLMANLILGRGAAIAIFMLLIIMIAVLIANRLSKIGNKRGGVW